MKKDDLIAAMTNEPGNISVEIALTGGNIDNTLYREVVGVEHRKDPKTGKEYVSLICLKSLKEQKHNTRSVLEEAKRIKEAKRQAAIQQALQDRPMPKLEDAPSLEPMELKPMELKPMQIKRTAAHTMADLPNIVKSLQQSEKGQQGPPNCEN